MMRSSTPPLAHRLLLCVAYAAGAALIATSDYGSSTATAVTWFAVHSALYWRAFHGGSLALLVIVTMAGFGVLASLVGDTGVGGPAEARVALSLTELAALLVYGTLRRRLHVPRPGF